MKKYVGYFRVSSQEQGKSGLGLEGQKNMVDNFIQTQKGTLINSFVEIETGTSKKKRIEIFKAIEFAKEHNAILCIAKIDRLARNVHFISSLIETGVEFVAVDMPTANNFTIHLYSALAEEEAKLISFRTRKALEMKKQQGYKLGTPENFTEERRKMGTLALIEKAKSNQNNIQATKLIVEYRDQGKSYDWIALRLNELGIFTANGKLHNSTSVHRLFRRFLETKKELICEGFEKKIQKTPTFF
jgi:DNA invertase Pin-like site-specific DNA recombinase